MNSSLLRYAHWVFAPLLAFSVGCNSGEDERASIDMKPHGPHGGHTAQVSGDAGFEMEFTLNEKQRRIVIYVQESGAPRPHPLAVDSLSGVFEADGQTVDVTFVADPRPDDPEGRASRFVLALDTLPQQLLVSDNFLLNLSYNSAGRQITASIPHNNNHAHEYRHD